MLPVAKIDHWENAQWRKYQAEFRASRAKHAEKSTIPSESLKAMGDDTRIIVEAREIALEARQVTPVVRGFESPMRSRIPPENSQSSGPTPEELRRRRSVSKDGSHDGSEHRSESNTSSSSYLTDNYPIAHEHRSWSSRDHSRKSREPNGVKGLSTSVVEEVSPKTTLHSNKAMKPVDPSPRFRVPSLKHEAQEQSAKSAPQPMSRRHQSSLRSPISEQLMYLNPKQTNSSLSSTASTRREQEKAKEILRRQKQREHDMNHERRSEHQEDKSKSEYRQHQPEARNNFRSGNHHDDRYGIDFLQSKRGLTEQRPRDAALPIDISLSGASRFMRKSPTSPSESSMSTSHENENVYESLRAGTSSSLEHSFATHDLSGALRSSTSNISGFSDFRNPNLKYEFEETPSFPISPIYSNKKRGTFRGSESQKQITHIKQVEQVEDVEKIDKVEIAKQKLALTDAPLSPPSTSRVLRKEAAHENDTSKYDGSKETSYYQFVSNHSILQLCTEDLMSDNWKLVDYALYRLCEVCCTSGSKEEEAKASGNRIRFVKAGGHALLVGVMKKFASVRDVQTSACRLVQDFVRCDGEGAFVELFASVHGVDRVLASIHRFTVLEDQDDALHRCGCGALMALVGSNLKMVERLFTDNRNVSLFVRAIGVDTKTVGVCKVLNHISKNSDFCKEIYMAGGVEEIIREMKENPDNQGVQEAGCSAMGNIVVSHKVPAAAEHIAGFLKGGQLIGAAMKNFPNVEIVQEKAIWALYQLSNHVQAPIKASGGLSTLGAAMEHFPRNKAIQKFGYVTMKQLLESGRKTSISPVQE